jgi:uncharacterized lipoprotein YajG
MLPHLKLSILSILVVLAATMLVVNCQNNNQTIIRLEEGTVRTESISHALVYQIDVSGDKQALVSISVISGTIVVNYHSIS